MIRSPSIVPTTKRTLQLYAKWKAASANHFDHGTVVFRQTRSTTSLVGTLLRDLRQLDTSSLCDAEKTVTNSDNGEGENGGIKLMNNTIRPMNYLHRINSVHGTSSGNTTSGIVMAGVARTVLFNEPNDFLPVMRALALEAKTDEVLVVDTMSSTRAVAGEIFVSEARRKGLAGIVIDGPIRDTAHLDQDQPGNGNDDDDESFGTTTTPRLYATSVTPYSGTTNSPGEMQAAVVTCGGVEVRPGDIVVGDDDGILVGDFETFSKLVPIAKSIQHVESQLMSQITSCSSSGNNTLTSMTNLDEHVQRRLEGKDSNLEFRIPQIDSK